MHYPAVRGYALRRTSTDAAQDVVAETFLTAWRRLDDVPADALPWLFGVARRVLANQRRSENRATALAERVAAAGPAATSAPEEALGEAELVRAALASLSEKDREALMLVAWHGLSGSERRARPAAATSPSAFACTGRAAVSRIACVRSSRRACPSRLPWRPADERRPRPDRPAGRRGSARRGGAADSRAAARGRRAAGPPGSGARSDRGPAAAPPCPAARPGGRGHRRGAGAGARGPARRRPRGPRRGRARRRRRHRRRRDLPHRRADPPDPAGGWTDTGVPVASPGTPRTAPCTRRSSRTRTAAAAT